MTVPGPCGICTARPLAPFRGEPSPQVTEGRFHAQSLNMRFPHPAARGLCARRRVSEANRGNAPALRPEITALPRYRQQMCNIFTPFRASRTPLLTNNLFAYHKILHEKHGKATAGSGDPALQEMAGHITLFIVCCKAKARGTMRTSSPTNHLQRLSQSAKFHPGGMRASRPAATFIVHHILHNQHPPPKFLISHS